MQAPCVAVFDLLFAELIKTPQIIALQISALRYSEKKLMENAHGAQNISGNTHL